MYRPHFLKVPARLGAAGGVREGGGGAGRVEAGRDEAGLLLETTARSSECDKSPTVMELAGGQAGITAVIKVGALLWHAPRTPLRCRYLGVRSRGRSGREAGGDDSSAHKNRDGLSGIGGPR
ncbi:hypothetical protein E2C01_044421 [Portunus trituberculatus]|uniref:Uncharacterized protein n=1 Tax=Portunus trituberculatus TaxID=210409 RepID=A0A5B7FVK3_PORTR|nr:hypothetical protein [Portunus trituberculatus]